MTYELQFTMNSAGHAPASVRVNSEVLPRVGDSIELDGVSYDAIVVWHVLTRQRADNGVELPCLVFEWIVRVKS